MSIISVFGLGYVGSVSLACLADNDHRMIGVDVNPTKVDMIRDGRSPVIEAGLDDLLRKGVQRGYIQVSGNADQAVHESEISMICVGTPSNSNGSLSLDYVRRVCEDIGRALATKKDFHLVVVRSTMLPGSTEEVVVPILEQTSGKRVNSDFGVCFNPEFLREGSSIEDFNNPPFTVIGTDNEKAGAILKDIYRMVDGPLLEVPFRVAEMVKYTNNAFHALKVTFANEIGNICKQQNIDSHQVMEIFSMDTKLNLSSYYLKPGFAFGGSCLPKDLKALLHFSHRNDVNVPVLEAILPSNRQQIEIASQMVRSTGRKRVGVLGFSFKAGTDDLRESPTVELIEYLIGKGYQIKVYDKNVSLANLHGANREYIEKEIPHIASLMADTIDDVVNSCEVIVIGNNSPEFSEILPKLRDDHTLIDLVRVTDDFYSLNGQYQGISW